MGTEGNKINFWPLLLLIIYLSVFGGAIGVFAKISLSAFSPLTAIFLRLLISLFIFIPFFLYKKRLTAFFIAVAWNWKKFLLLAASGVGAAMVVGFVGLRYTSAINYGLIYNLSPIFIFIFSAIFFKEKLRRLDIVLVLAALFGAVIIVTNGRWSPQLIASHLGGDLLVLVSAAGWALYSILGAKFSRENTDLDSTVVIAGSFLVSLIFLFPFVASQPSLGISTGAVNLKTVAAILALAVFSTALLFFLWFFFIKIKGGVWASLVSLSENLSGVILPIVFLGEALTWPIVIGGAIIIGAVAAKEIADRRRNNNQNYVRQ